MKFQLSINMERSSPADDMAEVAAHTLDMVRMAEAGGFHSVWAAEHHANEIYIAPNPFQILTWWAAHTTRIRLGVAVAVAPFWHPLRLAGEAALLDLHSEGRLELGIGSGALQREFDRLRPGLDQADGHHFVRELVPAVRALWAGDHALDGEHWSIPESTSVPKPRQPDPPLWIAARAPATFDFAVEHRCGVLTWALTLPMAEVESLAARLAAACEKYPDRPRPVFATMRYASVVEDPRELTGSVAAVRRRMAKLATLRANRGGVELGFPGEGEVPAPMAASDDELVRNLLFGTPDQVIGKIEAYHRLGVDEITYCASFDLDMAAQKRSLDLFIREVMPAFGTA